MTVPGPACAFFHFTRDRSWGAWTARAILALALVVAAAAQWGQAQAANDDVTLEQRV